MPNTLTNMQARIFADGAVRKLNQLLLPLRAFSTSFNGDAAKKGDTIRVPVFPTVTAGAFAGDYSAADITITGVDLTLDQHYFKSVAFTDREISESPADYFGNMGAQLGKAVAKSVLTTTMGAVTAANFGNTANADVLTIAAAGFGVDSVADIRGAAVKKGIHPMDASLVLAEDHYTSLLKQTQLTAQMYGGTEAIRGGQVPSLFGFDGVYESNIVPDNGESLAGFACARQALGVGMRYLEPQSMEAIIDAGMATDDESGVTLGVRVIPEPLKGKVHYVVEALWGYKTVDGAALVRIKSA